MNTRLETPPPEVSEKPISRLRRQDVWHLGLIFGVIYFIQGIGEPNEGLIAQPIRSLLKSWNYSTEDITSFAALLALPWSLKPLYGLLSDFVPLAGSRRRSYLILTTAATVGGLGLIYFVPPPSGSYNLLLALLLLPTVGVAFSDVVADALMVEKGQPAGITGQLQSIQWAAMYAATILTGTVGGFLSQHGFEREGFLICAGATLLTLVLAVFWIKEPRVERRESFREVIAELLMALRMPAIWLVASFLFLWNFNPFSTTVLYMHMTERMRFTEQFYGHSVSLMAGAAVVACVAYGGYCRRVPFGLLIHASIVLGILSTLAYWFLGGTISAVVISLAVGFVYMTSTLIQFDLAARVCPPHAAGTIFATLMALTNLSVSASTWIGGKMYAYGETRWGSDVAFHALVGIGAAFTAICWILVPGLRRHNREITHEAD